MNTTAERIIRFRWPIIIGYIALTLFFGSQIRKAEIDPDLYGHLNSVVCKLSRAVQAALEPDGMNVQQLNGKAANQLVPHLHIHLVPRWHGDGVTISWWEAEMGDAEKIKAHAEAIISKLAI